MAEYYLDAPLSVENARLLRTGDLVFLSGTIYSARDAAHQKLADLLDSGSEPPFPLQGAVIYYVSPTPAPEGRAIGSAGPTTSFRMDPFAHRLYRLGVKGTIGKGQRSDAVKQAMKVYGGIYFGATGGAGALLSTHITGAKIIAFEELGMEAIRELTVKDLPLLVINDSVGGELYVTPDLAAVGLE